jgi:hypothetical protein
MATPTTLPATAVAGEVLTAAYVNALRGAFRILQVVVGNYNTQAISSSASLADTGLTATITPSSTSSKILILAMQNGVLKDAGSTNNAVNLALLRGATQLLIVPEIGKNNTSSLAIHGSVPMFWLDAPATTSAVTYKTQFACNGGGANGAYVQYLNVQSVIILCEVSA